MACGQTTGPIPVRPESCLFQFAVTTGGRNISGIWRCLRLLRHKLTGFAWRDTAVESDKEPRGRDAYGQRHHDISQSTQPRNRRDLPATWSLDRRRSVMADRSRANPLLRWTGAGGPDPGHAGGRLFVVGLLRERIDRVERQVVDLCRLVEEWHEHVSALWRRPPVEPDGQRQVASVR